jgi:hypothetical protein
MRSRFLCLAGFRLFNVERTTVTPQQKEAMIATQYLQRPAGPDDIADAMRLCAG